MARIVGVDIPNEKRIVIALTYIYGIGTKTSKDILQNLKIDENIRTKDLSEDQISMLVEYITKNQVVEGTLKQRVFQYIKRLKDIRSYRGLRHKVGLPVRGQNTRKNAKTRKGRNNPIAIVKKG